MVIRQLLFVCLLIQPLSVVNCSSQHQSKCQLDTLLASVTAIAYTGKVSPVLHPSLPHSQLQQPTLLSNAATALYANQDKGIMPSTAVTTTQACLSHALFVHVHQYRQLTTSCKVWGSNLPPGLHKLPSLWLLPSTVPCHHPPLYIWHTCSPPCSVPPSLPPFQSSSCTHTCEQLSTSLWFCLSFWHTCSMTHSIPQSVHLSQLSFCS